MSLIEVKVPQLSESVSEATLLQWKKKPGEAVEQDEILVEIETDKVVLEVPAPASGVLAQIIKDDGDSVIGEEVIAKVDTEGQEATSGAMQIKSIPDAEPAPGERPGVPASVAALAAVKSEVAMPAAAKLMAEHDLPVGSVQGTGKGGRVTKGDVLEALGASGGATALAAQTAQTAQTATGGGAPAVARAPAPAAPAPAPAARPLPPVPAPLSAQLGDRPEQRVPMSRLRARIAERLLQSQATNAILTTFNEVNMAPVIEMRKRFQDKFEKEHGVKLGFMSFFVKAAVAALKRYPVINASVDGNDIVYHGYFDIGIAVGSPRGLVVPIVRNADQMSFADIEKKIAEYGQKAKDGKLALDELTGGTFSISNGGVFGSMLSTPIINPPQSAILGVHATKDRAVVENGQVVVRPMNYLAMSYDHRIIDGREAVLGLVAIKEALEDPARLLFDI
ncbi:MAG TPA: 2-oxoglutarate dehydrogenase complex dihydrolipoyllysine-residue succinyltransferase [Caldimonas sp.]